MQTPSYLGAERKAFTMRRSEIANWISAIAAVISVLVSIVALYNSNAAVSKVDKLQAYLACGEFARKASTDQGTNEKWDVFGKEDRFQSIMEDCLSKSR